MRLQEKHIQWLSHLADGPKERKGWWQYPIQCARAGLTRFVDPDAGDWREELTDLGREILSERQPNSKVQPASGQDTRCAGNHEAGSAGTQS